MSTTRRTVGALSTVALAAVSLTMTGGAAVAAPLPTLPDNMVIFPMRDFMTVEGFENRAGQSATVKVMRDGKVVGQTTAEINYPEPGVAFEVNHPGGVCWGEGAPAGLQVTPDLTAGDLVMLEVDGVTYETPIADVEVVSESRVDNTVTVTNRVPEDVPLERLEARIIAPDLGDTPVGRRDARATGDGTGDDGYTSSLTKSGTEVTATYTFTDADTAQIALEGTSRMYSWVSAQGEERAGITIYEHEEVGGPGMGGCPPGPDGATQPAPGSATFQRSADGTGMQVNWTPAESVAGALEVTGYQATAVDPDGNLLGKNTAADVTAATLSGLDATKTYTVQVRAAQGDTLSKPFPAGESTGGTGDGTPRGGDTAAPTDLTVKLSTGNEVTMGATDNSGSTQVYYTLDGTNPVTNGLPADGTVLYKAPFVITQDTTVWAAAFDAAGNWTAMESATTLTPNAVAAPDPLDSPSVTATPQSAGVKLDWNTVEGATDYEVTVSPAADGVTSPFRTSGARTATISGLTGETEYTFTVTAMADGRPSSAPAEVTATPDPFQSSPVVNRAQWKTGDLRIEGSIDVTTGTVKLYASDAAGTLGRQLGPVDGVNVTAAVAPETGGEFRLRLRNAAANPNPGHVVAVATDGGTSRPTPVTAR